MEEFDWSNFNPIEEITKMTSNEQAIMMTFVSKLQEAFAINGLDQLAGSQSAACRAVYSIYEQMKGGLGL